MLQTIKKRKSDVLIPNPIPACSPEYSSIQSLREEYGFSETDIVWGRMGRPANFHPIGLMAFKEAQKLVPNLKYIIVGGCEQAKSFVANNNLQGVVFVEPTNDDKWIERFQCYNTVCIINSTYICIEDCFYIVRIVIVTS